jgi:hypothetical protein
MKAGPLFNRGAEVYNGWNRLANVNLGISANFREIGKTHRNNSVLRPDPLNPLCHRSL